MKMSNICSDIENYNLIKKSLDVASVRSKVISYNIANVNNKGYKKYHVDFKDSLQDAEDKFQGKLTKEKHISTEDKSEDISIKRDTTSSMRQDGNNVDIDLEKVNQAANTLMYNAMIAQVNNRLSTKRYVINGK